jgi:hypothetical protein
MALQNCGAVSVLLPMQISLISNRIVLFTLSQGSREPFNLIISSMGLCYSAIGFRVRRSCQLKNLKCILSPAKVNLKNRFTLPCGVCAFLPLRTFCSLTAGRYTREFL